MKYIFHETIFTDLFCLVYFCLVLNKTTAATSRVYPLQTCLLHSPPSLAARPHALRPCARQTRGCHFNSTRGTSSLKRRLIFSQHSCPMLLKSRCLQILRHCICYHLVGSAIHQLDDAIFDELVYEMLTRINMSRPLSVTWVLGPIEGIQTHA